MAAVSAAPAAPTEITVNRRAGNGSLFGVIAGVASGAMFLAALCGAYVAVRTGVGADFVPSTMKFNNYAAFIIALGGLIASLSVEWALVSLKVRQRRWVSAGYGLGAILCAAAMNLIWFIGSNLGMGVNENPYATLVYAVLAAALALFAAGLVACVVALFLTLGGHASADNPLPARAANWVVHLATLGWIAAYALIFLYK